MNLSRRVFLQSAATVAMALPRCRADEKSPPAKNDSLAGEIGITSSSLALHMRPRVKNSKLTLLELPRILRNELDMRVIDLNTATLASEEPAYLDKVRAASEKAGCILTNLKLNQRGLDIGRPDVDVRRNALATYKKSIDTAARLGMKWARPVPGTEKSDRAILINSLRELADYAAERNIQLLVENIGWMKSDPEAVPKLVKDVNRNLAVSPDTGNWTDNKVRYKALAAAFPLAVTCDFKAFRLGPNGEHDAYDLKRCFDIGWNAGFTGPWCLEHGNARRNLLFKELALLRDKLREWMKAARQKKPN